jgi:anti-sigma B factor antagonist
VAEARGPEKRTSCYTGKAVKITSREVDRIIILDLDGRLTAGTQSSALRERIVQLSSEGQLNIILNLKSCEFIDSTGLGTMVVCYTALQKQGGALKLENLSKRHVELLVLTKLTTIFEIFDNERDAINSFYPDREVKRFDILDFVKEQTEN